MYNVYNLRSCHLLIPPMLSHDWTSGNPFWLPNIFVSCNLGSPFVSPPSCSLDLSLYLSLNSILHLSSHGFVSGGAFLNSVYGYGYSYITVRITFSPNVHRSLHFHCTATSKSTVSACWRDGCNSAPGFTPVLGASSASSPFLAPWLDVLFKILDVSLKVLLWCPTCPMVFATVALRLPPLIHDCLSLRLPLCFLFMRRLWLLGSSRLGLFYLAFGITST